jgi:quercetin dioxygenase-like cupin family protein
VNNRYVFNVMDVAGFSPKGAEDAYVSRMLVDRESVGSNSLTVNHFTLKAGKRTEAGSHPTPFDEFYYVLSGTGWVELGSPPEVFPVRPGTIAFIPRGTDHALRCDERADLELITVMPEQPVPGANSVYDERLKTWGTSFRMVET